jgi:hydroxymethylbilane synthase
LILAKAGLVRLGFGDRVTSDVIPPTLFRAVGQGALAVEIRTDDDDALTHWQTEWCCRAEREFLRVLESGRSVPVGVHSELKPAAGDARQGKLRLVGTITALDGQRHVQREVERDVSSPEQGEELGAQLAEALMKSGGEEILSDITKDRERRAG